MLCTCNTAFAGLLILCYELTAKNVQCVIDKESHDSFFFFFLNNFIYKTITYTTYSINYTYIVLATYTTDTYTYTNYAYTTLRYMYYNTININLIYGWRVYKVLLN